MKSEGYSLRSFLVLLGQRLESEIGVIDNVCNSNESGSFLIIFVYGEKLWFAATFDGFDKSISRDELNFIFVVVRLPGFMAELYFPYLVLIDMACASDWLFVTSVVVINDVWLVGLRSWVSPGFWFSFSAFLDCLVRGDACGVRLADIRLRVIVSTRILECVYYRHVIIIY